MTDVVPGPVGATLHPGEGDGRLGLGLIWTYTLSRVAFMLMGVLFAVYLMKYATDVLLIAPATMGLLLAAARLWDGVTDPLVGYLSDRTRSRLGRRRVWLYGSALPQVVFTPFWMWLARRIGKQRAWTAALLLSSVPFIWFYFLAEPGVTFWVLTFLCGFLAGCGAVVQPAIQADVIDYDELTTGDRKEGAYLAVWNLVRKCSASLCVLIAGLVLQFAGFEPNQVQSQQTIEAIRGIFGLLPAACYLVGGLLFMRFAFNEAEHRAARTAIEQRARTL